MEAKLVPGEDPCSLTSEQHIGFEDSEFEERGAR